MKNTNIHIFSILIYIFLFAAFLTSGCVAGNGVVNESENEANPDNSETTSVEPTVDTQYSNTFEATEAPGASILQWQRDLDETPDAVYPAEAWFTDGHLTVPFNAFDTNDGVTGVARRARLIVPEEALKQAGTNELIQLLGEVSYAGPSMFNFPSQYLVWLENNLNIYGEMMSRTDFAEVLLANYTKDEFEPYQVYVNGAEQYSYEMRMSAWNNGIGAKEVLLASNEVFLLMNDEMKRQTLDAVLEKQKIRENSRLFVTQNAPYIDGEILVSEHISAFYRYINELQFVEHIISDEDGELINSHPAGSRWYEYIINTLQDEEAAGYIAE